MGLPDRSNLGFQAWSPARNLSRPLATPPHLPVEQQLPLLRLQLVLLLLEEDPEPVPVLLQAGLALLPLTLLVVYHDARNGKKAAEPG